MNTETTRRRNGNPNYTAAGLKCRLGSGFLSWISHRRRDTEKCPRHTQESAVDLLLTLFRVEPTDDAANS